MAKTQKMTVETRDVAADVQRLEIEIRQLKIEYDRYFSGNRDKEPQQLLWSVKKLIKEYAETPFRQYQYRFKYNTLVSRFHIFSERWNRQIRVKEEGIRPRAASQIKKRVVARCIFDDAPDSQNLRELYSNFVAARKASDESKGSPSYEMFIRGITAQVKKLQNDAECAEIELRVVQDGRNVQVRARRRG